MTEQCLQLATSIKILLSWGHLQILYVASQVITLWYDMPVFHLSPASTSYGMHLHSRIAVFWGRYFPAWQTRLTLMKPHEATCSHGDIHWHCHHRSWKRFSNFLTLPLPLETERNCVTNVRSWSDSYDSTRIRHVNVEQWSMSHVSHGLGHLADQCFHHIDEAHVQHPICLPKASKLSTSRFSLYWKTCQVMIMVKASILSMASDPIVNPKNCWTKVVEVSL